MKKHLLLFTSFALLAGAAFAQDIDNNDLSFAYVQLPLKPLNKNLKNYQAKVVLQYQGIVDGQKAAYQDALTKNEADYRAALNAQSLLQNNADVQYTKEMAAWNKRPMAEQIAYAKDIPKRTIIPLPIKQVVPEPSYLKLYDANLLAGKYIKLEGYNNVPDNAVNITVSLLGFSSKDPVQQERTLTSAANGVPAKKKYWYTVPYKHMMSYKIETPTDGVIVEEYPSGMDNYIDYKTSEFDSVPALVNYWTTNKNTVTTNLQDQVVVDNLNTINSTINDKYGYMKLTRRTELSTVDEKENYQDYKEAYVAAGNGYGAIIQDISKTPAVPELKKAIGLWENAMKESQPNNKKARVDGGVTAITILNLIEAYIWLDDYANAQAYIDKLKTLDPSRKERHRMERLIEFMAVQKTRYEANK